MEIRGYNAANIQSMSDILGVSIPKLVSEMISAYIEKLPDEQVFKLFGVSSEEEAMKLFEDVISPILTSEEDKGQRRFRVWYDERSLPTAWVVDALKVEDIYDHPFIGRYDFATYNTFTALVRKAMELGVKPDEIVILQ